jgi:hypothetical protein
VKTTRNDEPIPFNRVGDTDRIGFDRAQVAEGFPSLRLAASRLIEFANDANRRLLDRANFWRASSACSALRCCALRHICYQGAGATRSRAATPRYDRPAGVLSSHGLQGAGRPNDGLEGVVPRRVALRQQYPKPV